MVDLGTLQAGLGVAKGLAGLFGSSGKSAQRQQTIEQLQWRARDARLAGEKFGFNPLTMLGVAGGGGGGFIPQNNLYGALGDMQSAVGLLEGKNKSTDDAEIEQAEQADRDVERIEKEQDRSDRVAQAAPRGEPRQELGAFKPATLTIAPGQIRPPRLSFPDRVSASNRTEFERFGPNKNTNITTGEVNDIMDVTNQLEPGPTEVINPMGGFYSSGGNWVSWPRGEEPGEQFMNFGKHRVGLALDRKVEKEIENATINSRRRNAYKKRKKTKYKDDAKKRRSYSN